MLSVIVEIFLGKIIPYIAGSLEAIGVVIIVISAIRAIGILLNSNLDFSKEEVKLKFSMGLALALEFKLGAEIIKTVLIKNLEEFYVLAVVTILRMLIGFVIQGELKAHKEEGEVAEKEKETIGEKIKKII